ncbi:MAG: FAD binding domain-containing protein [Firmicutes bacterium]|nr:FAD binding domain-containing protein [Bacillota bacterium]
MLKIRQYVRPETLEEAYELCLKKNNRIIGGMLWLKMQDLSVNTAIDLQDLNLDTIEENEYEYRIGCMVSLRQIELHEGLNAQTQGAVSECVKHIVGVQFRNLATIGGSIWGRFGFSDVLTLFMSIDAKVELYERGIMSIEEFADMPRTVRDLLIRIIVPKVRRTTVYRSQRNASTDFPVLACAVSKTADTVCCSVGARPGKAIIVRELPDDPAEAAEYAVSRLSFGTNLRGSREYRMQICRVLVRRAMEQLKDMEV